MQTTIPTNSISSSKKLETIIKFASAYPSIHQNILASFLKFCAFNSKKTSKTLRKHLNYLKSLVDVDFSFVNEVISKRIVIAKENSNIIYVRSIDSALSFKKMLLAILFLIFYQSESCSQRIKIIIDLKGCKRKEGFSKEMLSEIIKLQNNSFYLIHSIYFINVSDNDAFLYKFISVVLNQHVQKKISFFKVNEVNKICNEISKDELNSEENRLLFINISNELKNKLFCKYNHIQNEVAFEKNPLFKTFENIDTGSINDSENITIVNDNEVFVIED